MKRTVKAGARTAFLTILAATMVMGCGNDGGKQNSVIKSDAADEKSETVELTFLTNEASGDEKKLEYYEQLIEKFETEYPGISIELLQGGDWQDMDTKLNAAMLSNTYPDIILAPLNTVSQRASMGDFTDLSEYLSGWEDREDILKASINIGTYKGINYGIGAFPVPEIIMYRKDYFAEAGLDPEQPPETWEQMYEAAKKLVVYDESGNVERGGFDVPVSDPNVTLMEVFLRQGGNPVIDRETDEICFDQESGVRAMEFLKRFIDEKLTITYQRGTDDPILSGKSAMGIVYVDAVRKLLKDDPTLRDKVGFIPYLDGGEKVAFTGYRVISLSESCKNKDAAWEFIKYFYNADEMWERYEEINYIPVRKSLSSQYMQEDPELNTIVMDSVEHGCGRPVSGHVSLITKYEVQAYEEIMNDVKEAEQALKDAAESARNEIASQN